MNEGSNFPTSTLTPGTIIFLIMATLVDAWWYHFVVLMCISLLTNDGNHYFHVVIGHLYNFFGEVPFWKFEGSYPLYILYVSLLLYIHIVNIFPQSMACFFNFS